MALSASTSGTMNELEAYSRAYIQLFQAVLKKKPDSESAKSAILAELRSYLKQNIRTPEEFISHISYFARTLRVDEGALGSFIGANFMKALASVKEQEKQRPASPSSGGGPKVRGGGGHSSIFGELEAFLGGLESPGRFIPISYGLVKLRRGEEEILPGSIHQFDGGVPVAPSAPARPPSDSIGDRGGIPSAGAPVVPQARAPEAAKPVAWSLPKEIPLIQEILEKFGSVLDIHTKLIPSPFPAGQQLYDGADAPASSEKGGETPSGTAVDPGAVPSFGESAGGAASLVPDRPIALFQGKEVPLIREILEKFGSVLDIHEKLEVSPWSDGMEPRNDLMMEEEEEEEEEEWEEELPPAIPMNFDQFMGMARTIHQYQTARDQAGYQNWLQRGAGVVGKAYVGLRNLDWKRKQGHPVDFETEYRNLAPRVGEGIQPAQLREFHGRIHRMEQLHNLLNRLVADAKGWPPGPSGSLRQIWSQFREMFNVEGDYGSLKGRALMILLQIPDESLRNELIARLDPYIKKAGEILAPR